MSIHVYARATKLTDVQGRIDYISNPDRQEHLLATASTVNDPDFWKKLANDSQTAWRQAGGNRDESKCCEAREFMGALPNSALTRDLPDLAKGIAEWWKELTGADCDVAIHQNKTMTQMHFHLVYSERDLLQKPEIRVADRNVFLDENGIRKRTKKEILDENGQLRPGCKIVPKGAVISERYFGDKNPMFKDMGWLYDQKRELANWINQELDPDLKREVFDRHGPFLAQKHIGKGCPKDLEKRLVNWNVNVKEFNKMVKAGIIPEAEAIRLKTRIALSPDQMLELMAVRAEIYSAGKNEEDIPKLYSDIRSRAGAVQRSADGPDERFKRELRDAYRRSKQAWQAYQQADPGSLEAKMLMVKARNTSSEIDRLRRQLGYDRPITTKDRQNAIWAVHADNKAAVIESGDLQRQKQAAYEARAAKWDAYKKQKAVFDQLDPGWHRRADGRWTRGKLLEIPDGYFEAKYYMQMAKEEYNQARRCVQLFNRARDLETAYRRFALDLASDPNVSDEDVARAKEKYQAAARRLRNPDQSTYNELQHQLSDLKKSQKIRDAKAAEAKKAEKEKDGEPGR